MQNILTLDIEDWYQSSLEILGKAAAVAGCRPTDRVVTNTHQLLDILAEYNIQTTCFVLGTVAETFPDLVLDIQAAGHDVASHGYGHELVYKLTPEQFRADVTKSIHLLEDITGRRIMGYRAPYCSITQKSRWALDILSDSGLEYDSSIFPIRRRLYGFPGWERFPHTVYIGNGRSLLELPISTLSFLEQNIPVSGGGYFRLLPYRFIRWAIRAINRQGQPAVFYLHPYELDAEELRHPLPGETWKTRFVRLSQGLNRGKTEGKLRRLLSDFEWTSVREWMAGRK